MSWSGFKKNVNRATTQVMMKTGHVEKTSDREYEVEERRYRTLESASMRLQKEAKGYLDSLRAMTASQMRIAETIDAFYGDSGARDGVSRSYKQAVEDLDAETVKALDGPYRCVSPDLLRQAEYAAGMKLDCALVREIEAELNWKAGKRRTYTRSNTASEGPDQFESALELMEYVYRTTVLEPINRFCAYFPDVNECIKKRNHKMLDYDAMRSKVKKLTEKPDKDPGKLPRTEKETEMVHHPTPPFDHPPAPARPSHTETATEPGESLNAAPALRRSESPGSFNLHSPILRSPSMLSRITSSRRASRIGVTAESTFQHSTTAAANEADAVDLRDLNRLGSSTETLRPSVVNAPQQSAHDVEVPEADITALPPYPIQRVSRKASRQALDNRSWTVSSGLNRLKQRYAFLSSSDRGLRIATPFFNPSELEDIMAPLRAEYVQNEANALKQAKVAYEQLNDQLTNELPQLIDLRVPYLDPTFEALVKIQLRFCAEAYSRMAQVQQYLDASTRDQYANGELDARVEDVLSQIRELSIAGTV